MVTVASESVVSVHVNLLPDDERKLLKAWDAKKKLYFIVKEHAFHFGYAMSDGKIVPVSDQYFVLTVANTQSPMPITHIHL